MPRAAVAILLLFPLLAGCGTGHPPTYPVTGKVTFPDGKPLAAALVEFRIAGPDGAGTNARGETNAEGVYQLTTYDDGDGALEGEHSVLVVPPPAPPSNMDGPAPKSPIARKFLSYDTSELKYTVKPSPNEYDIVVKRE
jgi:hypothetical protein